MVEIIPAILEDRIDLVAQRLKQVEPFVKQVQVDIADGKFVPNRTHFSAQDLLGISTSLSIELHMMVKEPTATLPVWCTHPQLNRIIVHVESSRDVRHALDLIRSCGKEACLALNPETRASVIESLAGDFDRLLVMGVHPGHSGQAFLDAVLPKIKFIRMKYSRLPIEVDGGITHDNAKSIVEAGASALVTNTLIFQNNDIDQNIRKLQQAI